MAKAVIDLSKMTPEAVKSQVLNKTAFSPLTIYPMFGAIGLFAFWVIFSASWIFTLFGGLCFVGGAGYFAQYFYEQGGRLPRGSVMRGVWGGLGIYSHCVALFAAAAGIIGFVWGAWQGITALQGTNGGLTKQSLFNFVGSAFG